MRHVGLLVRNMDREIEWWKLLGYEVKIHRTEVWAHRRLEVVKMQRANDPVMIEFICVLTGEWAAHVAIDVDSWPKSPVIVRELGEPFDDDLQVGFAVSPNGHVVELVKRTSGESRTFDMGDK